MPIVQDPSWSRRRLPVLQWLPRYPRSWWRFDVVGGLTVAALLVPEGMAYAQLAGVGPQAAFYAAPAALVLYGLLGTSRQLVVAVSSAVAITSAATVSLLATQGTAEYISLTAALALLAGLVSVVAGLLRLGRIAQFFSSSVLVGFVFGLALIITMKQIPKLLGIDVSEQDFFAGLRETLRHLGDTSLVTLAVGLTCIATMAVIERLVPRLPAALVMLIGSLVASALLDLQAHGVAVVGALPSGLTTPKLPGVGISTVPLLLSGAVGIALLVFAEATGPAQRFAREHGQEVDPNQELIALGGANMGAGLFQGFPAGASLSNSAANNRAGTHTPLALFVGALVIALVALFLTPLFEDLPEAALAAIVVVAVSDMERLGPIRRLWRLRRADALLALVALGGVLVLDILPGLALAVVASLGVVLWRASEARLALSGLPAGETPEATDGTAPPTSGLLVVRPDQMLFFVNATEVRDAVLAAVDRAPGLDVVVLDLGLTPDLDVPSTDVIGDLVERLERRGTELWIVTGSERAEAQLRAAGVSDTVGTRHVFDGVAGALVAFLDRHASGGDAAGAVDAVLRALREGRRDPPLAASVPASLRPVERQLLHRLRPFAIDTRSSDDPTEHPPS